MSANSHKRTFRSFSEPYSIRPDTPTNLPRVVILCYHRAQFWGGFGKRWGSKNGRVFKDDYTPKTMTPDKKKTALDPESDHLTSFRLFERGEVLFKEGDRGAEAYVIKSGCVQISVVKDNIWEDRGFREAPSIIGEMAIISDMPRMATAIAEEETVCIALSRAVMRKLLESVDLETRAIVEFLIDHIRDADRGEPPDDEPARRNVRILKHLLDSPETKARFETLDPFFALLCQNLVERAEKTFRPA